MAESPCGAPALPGGLRREPPPPRQGVRGNVVTNFVSRRPSLLNSPPTRREGVLARCQTLHKAGYFREGYLDESSSRRPSPRHSLDRHRPLHAIPHTKQHRDRLIGTHGRREEGGAVREHRRRSRSTCSSCHLAAGQARRPPSRPGNVRLPPRRDPLCATLRQAPTATAIWRLLLTRPDRWGPGTPNGFPHDNGLCGPS